MAPAVGPEGEDRGEQKRDQQRVRDDPNPHGGTRLRRDEDRSARIQLAGSGLLGAARTGHDELVEPGVKARHAEAHLLGDPADHRGRAMMYGHEIGRHRELDEADLGPGDRTSQRAVSPRHHRPADLATGGIEGEPNGTLKAAQQVVVLRDIREPWIRAGAGAEKRVARPARDPYRERRVDALDPSDGDPPSLVLSPSDRRAQRHRLPGGRCGRIADRGVLAPIQGEGFQQAVPVRRARESPAAVSDHEDRPRPSRGEHRDCRSERGSGQDTSSPVRSVTAACVRRLVDRAVAETSPVRDPHRRGDAHSRVGEVVELEKCLGGAIRGGRGRRGREKGHDHEEPEQSDGGTHGFE